MTSRIGNLAKQTTSVPRHLAGWGALPGGVMILPRRRWSAGGLVGGRVGLSDLVEQPVVAAGARRGPAMPGWRGNGQATDTVGSGSGPTMRSRAAITDSLMPGNGAALPARRRSPV